MADEQSNHFLTLNFGARTFEYRRLAQGLNRSLSAFKSFVREYFDTVVKTDGCAQNVDDITIAGHTADELLQNIEIVFQRIEIAGLKHSLSKCTFGQDKLNFQGRQLVNKV